MTEAATTEMAMTAMVSLNNSEGWVGGSEWGGCIFFVF